MTTRHRRRPRRLILAATAASVLTIGGLGAALAHASTGTEGPAGDPGTQESATPSPAPAEPTPAPSEPGTPSEVPAEPTPVPSEPETPSEEPQEPTPAPSEPGTPSEEPQEPTPVPEEPGTPTPLAPGEPAPEWEK